MPQVFIKDSTYERLQRHAEPLVDSVDTVINRALGALEHGVGGAASTGRARVPNERQIDPKVIPNLTHTKVLDASIGGQPFARPNWKRLVQEMLRRSMKQAGNVEQLRRICPVNVVEGKKEDEGFNYLPHINISFQGQDANDACRAIVTAASALGILVDIGFMWRNKSEAAHPGERARLKVLSLRETSGR